MVPSFDQVREAPEGDPPDLGELEGDEAREWDDRRALEGLEQLKQDREERKRYARRIFWLVVSWLTVIVLLLFLQGFLGPCGAFALSDSVLIAVATTTTASVTAILVVVVRYLFPRS